MSRFVNRKSILSVLVALTLVVAFAGGVFLRGSGTRVHASGGTRYGAGNNNPVCAKNSKSIELSQGGQIFCNGPQPNSPASSLSRSSTSTSSSSSNPSFGSNVDAASPQEDVTPSGVQMHGQS